MKITGTHFNYYQVCKRKLWLFANSINFEHTSDLVYEGRLIHDDSYPQRSSKYEEIEIPSELKERVSAAIAQSTPKKRSPLFYTNSRLGD